MSFFCVRNLVYQGKCFFTRKISIFANLSFSRIISLHTSCPASNLSCIRPVMYTSCPASILSYSLIYCFQPVLHLSCPASVLSCIHPVLHPSCPAYVLPCIRPVLHTSCHAYALSCIDAVLLSHLLFTTCPTSVLSCIGPVLHPSCPAAFPPYILPVLQPSCPEAFLSCFCLHTSCPVETNFFLNFKITVMTYDFALLSQQFFLTLTNL